MVHSSVSIMAWYSEMINIFIYLLLLVLGIFGADYPYDFDNANDCSRYYAGAQKVTPQDMVYITANPRQSNIGGPLGCIFKFELAGGGGGLRLFAKHFTIVDCGVQLEIYDQNRFIKDPKWILDCKSPANTVYSIEGAEMTLRLAKSSTVAYGYRFDMQLTTGDSHRKEFPSEVYRPGTQRSTLTEGAIIGVSVSCVVAGGVLIGIIIFFVIRKRREGQQQRPSDAKGQSPDVKPMPFKQQYNI